jgi:hypothetical protein
VSFLDVIILLCGISPANSTYVSGVSIASKSGSDVIDEGTVGKPLVNCQRLTKRRGPLEKPFSIAVLIGSVLFALSSYSTIG